MQLNNSRPTESLEWLSETVARGESIYGRLSREHRERRAAAEARRLRVRRALLLLNLIGWPLAALATVALTQLLFP
jgi:hypothetical protein